MAKDNHIRDIRLDAIRGLLLVVMSIDHFPSVLQRFTYQTLGFVSAAEGFVFLSGYVAGMIYARTMAQHGLAAITRKALLRARTIYLLHIFTFCFAFFAMGFIERESLWNGTWGLRHEDPVAAMLLGACLLYQPQYDCDILPMYCIFVAAIPILVLTLRHKRFLVLLFASAGVWALAQAGLGLSISAFFRQFAPVDFGSFEILAWQFLFIAGFVLGYYKTDQGRAMIQIGPKAFYAIGSFAVVLFLFRHNLLPFSEQVGDGFWTDRHLVGPVRLVNFAALAILLSHPALWPGQQLWTRALALLGRNSLTVFGFHLILVYFIQCFVLSRVMMNEGEKILLTVAVIALLLMIAWLSQFIDRRKRPAHSAVVCGG